MNTAKFVTTIGTICMIGIIIFTGFIFYAGITKKTMNGFHSLVGYNNVECIQIPTEVHK